MKSLEDRFDTIIQSAIHEADEIQCSPEEYISNMRYWISEIELAINAMEESNQEEDSPEDKT